MSSLAFSTVVFKVYAECRHGETVVIAGNAPALGGFALRQAVPLHTSPESYPLWSSPPIVLPRNVPVKYKYAIFAAGTLQSWENVPGDRFRIPTEVRCEISDAFGIVRSEDTVSRTVADDQHDTRMHKVIGNRSRLRRQRHTHTPTERMDTITPVPSPQESYAHAHNQVPSNQQGNLDSYDEDHEHAYLDEAEGHSDSEDEQSAVVEKTSSQVQISNEPSADHNRDEQQNQQGKATSKSLTQGGNTRGTDDHSEVSVQRAGRKQVNSNPLDPESAAVVRSHDPDWIGPSVRRSAKALQRLMHGRKYFVLTYHLPVILRRHSAGKWQALWDTDSFISRSDHSVANQIPCVWIGCVTRRCVDRVTPEEGARRRRSSSAASSLSNLLSHPQAGNVGGPSFPTDEDGKSIQSADASSSLVSQSWDASSVETPAHSGLRSISEPVGRPTNFLSNTPTVHSPPCANPVTGQPDEELDAHSLGFSSAAVDAATSRAVAAGTKDFRDHLPHRDAAVVAKDKGYFEDWLSLSDEDKQGIRKALRNMNVEPIFMDDIGVTERTFQKFHEYLTMVLRPALHNVLDIGNEHSIFVMDSLQQQTLLVNSEGNTDNSVPRSASSPPAEPLSKMSLVSPETLTYTKAVRGTLGAAAREYALQERADHGFSSKTSDHPEVCTTREDADEAAHKELPSVRAARLQSEGWEAYKAVNRGIADAVARVHRKGDPIWSHDFQLCLMPQYLSEVCGDSPQIFFMHNPFPTSEIFRTLPMREELLQGILRADVVGFHTFNHARHFLQCCKRILGLNFQSRQGGRLGLDCKGRDVMVAISHVGVEVPKLKRWMASEEAAQHAAHFRTMYPNKIVIAGFDTCQRLSGVALKLLAFERLLEDNPVYRKQVVLVQRCEIRDSQPADYVRTSAELTQLVARIRARFGEVIDYAEAIAYPPTYRIGLFHTADVLLQTPIREGLNLLPLEYVYARTTWTLQRIRTGRKQKPVSTRAPGAAVRCVSCPQGRNTEASNGNRSDSIESNVHQAPAKLEPDLTRSQSTPLPGSSQEKATTQSGVSGSDTAARTHTHDVTSQCTTRPVNTTTRPGKKGIGTFFGILFSPLAMMKKNDKGSHSKSTLSTRSADVARPRRMTTIEEDVSPTDGRQPHIADATLDLNASTDLPKDRADPSNVSSNKHEDQISTTRDGLDHTTFRRVDSNPMLQVPHLQEPLDAPLPPPPRGGCVVLSEFSTASHILNSNLIVNPWNISEVSHAIDKALLMSDDHRAFRQWRDYVYATRNPSAKWAREVLVDLLEERMRSGLGSFTEIEPSEMLTYSRRTTLGATHSEGNIDEAAQAARDKIEAQVRANRVQRGGDVAGELLSFDPKVAIAAFNESKKHVIILDYGGTLVDAEGVGTYVKHEFISSMYAKGRHIPQHVFDALESMSKRPDTSIYILSGMSLEAAGGMQLAQIPGINIVAENGYSVLKNHGGEREWFRLHSMEASQESEWRRIKSAAKGIMRDYVWRVNGSLISEGVSVITWLHRNSDPEWAQSQARFLAAELEKRIATPQVKVTTRKTRVEVELRAMNKAALMQQIVRMEPDTDFVLAIGDDSTDEELFMSLHAMLGAGTNRRTEKDDISQQTTSLQDKQVKQKLNDELVQNSETGDGALSSTKSASEQLHTSEPLHALAVKVGRGRTHARFFVPSVGSVHTLLETIATELR